MRIATWNVNSIKQRLDAVVAWLAERQPDIVCLQETKCVDDAFPREPFESLGYNVAIHGQKTFNGVALLSKFPFDEVSNGLPGDHADDHARFIEAVVSTASGALRVASIYLPNGNPQPGPKFTYKLAWFDRLISHASELLKADVPVVLAGDYNVVPTPQDIYPTRSLDKNALIQPQSRAAFARLLGQGWTDALRQLQPDGPLWTFWDYEFGRWPADKGMRLDHLLLSPAISKRLAQGGVERWVRGEENASDHAPAWITLDQ